MQNQVGKLVPLHTHALAKMIQQRSDNTCQVGSKEASDSLDPLQHRVHVLKVRAQLFMHAHTDTMSINPGDPWGRYKLGRLCWLSIEWQLCQCDHESF